MLLIKASGAWLVMLLAAFLNGAIREIVITPLLGERVGHVASVFLLSVAVFGIACGFVRVLGPLPSQTLFLVGGLWLVLSVGFELGFFHYVMHVSWERLLADYNILQGRLLIIVWLSTFLSPLVCSKFLDS